MNWEQLPFLIYFLQGFKYVLWEQCEVTGKLSLIEYSKEPFDGCDEITLMDYFGDEEEAMDFIKANPNREDVALLKQAIGGYAFPQ